MSNKVGIRAVTIGIILTQLSNPALAQFEDIAPPPPPDTGISDLPAPPPLDFGDNSLPAPGEGDFGGGANGGGGSVGSPSRPKKTNEIVAKDKRAKLAKASVDEITNENYSETIESFDFPNVDIQEIVKAVSELTGKNFIIDNGIKGKITIIAPSKITVAEAYRAFLSALAMNGFTVVPYGSFLKIRSIRDARSDSIETYSGAYYPTSDQLITKIIHLKHISAEQVQKDLKILASNRGDFSVYQPTNSIILTDFGSSVDRIVKIITQLDVPGFEEKLEVVPIKFAKAKDLADLVDKIVNKGSGNSNRTNTGFSAGTPRFTRASGSQQGASYFMAIPEDRTNSIIIVGNASGIERVKKLISQLDFRIKPEETGGVNVYYVKHGDAEKIASVLQGIAKDASPKAGGMTSPIGFPMAPQQSSNTSAEIFGGDVKISADKNTNSLIITASKQDYEMVLSLLAKIDIPRDQVYVEGVIMEMSHNETTDYGIGYYQYGDSSGIGRAGFNGLGSGKLSTLLNPVGGEGAILGFGHGSTVSIDVGGKKVDIKSLTGFINFLKTTNNGNIISTPQILAMDNQEATFEVGERVVVGVNKTTTAQGQETTSQDWKDVTIKLVLKPFISPASESIRMEINQEVNQLSPTQSPKALVDTSRSTAKRLIKTNIVIDNGDTAVLGGMMNEKEFENVSKVPILGDIPILGWLFKSKNVSKDKVNMVAFLTPKIIRTKADKTQVLGRAVEDRVDFIKTQGGRDPFGKKMDQLTKGKLDTRGDDKTIK